MKNVNDGEKKESEKFPITSFPIYVYNETKCSEDATKKFGLNRLGVMHIKSN